MGREARANEEARKYGQFNVKVIIHFIDGGIETINADTWQDTPNSLALQYTGGTPLNPVMCLKVIPHTSIRSFDVKPQTVEDSHLDLNALKDN